MDWKALQNGSDIRGVAVEGVAGEPVNLSPDVARKLGSAFGTWLAGKTGKSTRELRLAIGVDSRISGPSLKAAASAGLTSLGCSVADFGLASTPAMFMSTIVEGYAYDGSIMLTASHLPFNRNGMKFFTPAGGLEKGDITEILGLAERGKFEAAVQTGTVSTVDFMSVYAGLFVRKIREEVAPDADQPLRGLHVIVDAGNGAGGFYVDKVLKPLGAETGGSQYLEPDGRFPNHVPNPEAQEAMDAICLAVKENQADFGIIFDTDVDRAAAVDGRGEQINRNRLIALSAAVVLEERPGSTIVTDSITSDGLTDFIENTLGGRHHRFKRGYKNVINEAIRLNREGNESWLAIETSGHAAMKENYFLDDGAYLVTKILIKLAKLRKEGKSLQDLIGKLPEPAESREFRIAIRETDFKSYGKRIIEELEEFSKSQPGWRIVPKNYEGVRVSCTGGWFLLRLSLHDPVIPLNIESDIQGGVAAIAAQLSEFLRRYEGLDISRSGLLA